MKKWLPLLALGIGLLAVSTAAIFIRLAQEANAPSLVVAAGRMTVAALLVTIPTVRQYQPQIRQLARRDWHLVVAGGIMLGAHFATWISSLEYTSVTNSVVLVTTNPLWVALLSPIFLNEKLNKWVIGGLFLALAGGLIVALGGDAGDPPNRPDPLLGSILALLGAITAGGYFMVGRQLRRQLPLLPYIWLVYSTAAIFLLLTLVLTNNSPFGLATEAYVWMLLLGVVPQLIGHSSFNYALAFFPAVYVTVVTLAEPIGSSILAIAFLGELPGIWSLVGACFILAGIAVASKEQFTKARQRRTMSINIAEL